MSLILAWITSVWPSNPLLLDVKERIVTARLSSVAYQLGLTSPKSGGRFAPEWVAGIGRNQRPEWSGIRIQPDVAPGIV